MTLIKPCFKVSLWCFFETILFFNLYTIKLCEVIVAKEAYRDVIIKNSKYDQEIQAQSADNPVAL